VKAAKAKRVIRPKRVKRRVKKAAQKKAPKKKRGGYPGPGAL
jgi:hypothetical protein